jgi:RNA polymerase sigma-70 factor, ECF subfamily
VLSVATIALAKQGDREALAAIFREHHPAVLRYLRGLAISHAEDVAGQVWVDVARSLSRFEGDDDDLRRWLFTIARRRMIDAFRADSRRADEPSAELPLGPAAEAADASIERLEWAEAVLRRLPPVQAEVVMLRVIVGLSVPEVAAIVDKSPGAVRVLAHRGLARVLEILADEGVVTPPGEPPVSEAGETPGADAAEAPADTKIAATGVTPAVELTMVQVR